MADQEGKSQAMETETEQSGDSHESSLKKPLSKEEVIKENGIEDEADNNEAISNGSEDGSEVTPDPAPETKTESKTTTESKDGAEDLKDEAADSGKTSDSETDKTDKEEAKVSNTDGPSEDVSNDKEEGKDVKEETTSVNDPKTDNENDETSKDASEVNSNEDAMDVDEDSNAVGSNSNISAPVSVDNDSKQASLMSEDNSRDSVTSAKSASDAESSKKDGFVSKVKDEEGTDIVITLNDNDKNDDGDDSQEASDTGDSSKTPAKVKQENDDSNSKSEDTPTTSVESTPKQNIQLTNTVVPPNAKVVRQGDKVGYLTRVGNQNLFIPISTTAPNSSTTPSSAASSSSGKQQTPSGPPLKPEDLKPKSSLDMIELMRWELYNRVPDNFNWSVAFHPKKEELSAITSFLLELGHDVVKEAVYKDIIQIQTKKKENGDLKDNEIESLEKMKTVYDNTKKKVEHLFLDSKSCDSCKFKTESSVVRDFHKDFPHYDPPWDTHKGSMKCSYCNYSTKVGLQFVLHMETIHKAHAKFPEKEHTFNCELCPLSTSTKNKLEKHRVKCEKHFKLGSNLQPYFHDVNFSMKNMYYKPKKLVPKSSPATQQAISTPKPTPPRAPTAPVTTPQRPNQPQQQTPTSLQNRPTRGPTTPVVHPPIPKLQPPTKSPFQSTPPAKFRTAAANMPNYPPKQSVPPNRGGRHTTNKEMQGFEVCELCGGYVKDRQALRIHFYYAHKVEMPQAIFTRPTPPLICDVCQSKFWTTQGLSKHKSTLRHFSSTGPAPAAFGTNQMCFMCMKKVPNLFNHVEQVHGMSMKDLIVMKKCIMCGVTANDKRSLESHLATAHGILMKAADLIGPNEKGPAPARNSPQPQQQPTTPKSGKTTNVARQNLCVFCQIQFADNIQLTMHCIKVHATCNGCGMVVASTKHLNYHSCKVMKRKCIICGLKNIAPEVYAVHVKSHVKPCNVHMDKLSSEEIQGVKEKIKKEYKPQIISLDSDEDSEVEIFDKDAKPNDNESKSEKEEDSKDKKNVNDESHDSKMTNGDVKPETNNGEVDPEAEENDLTSNANDEENKTESSDVSKDTNEAESVQDEAVSQEQISDLDNASNDKSKDNADQNAMEDSKDESKDDVDENAMEEESSETNGQDDSRKRKLTEEDEGDESEESDSKKLKVDEGSNAESTTGASPDN